MNTKKQTASGNVTRVKKEIQKNIEIFISVQNEARKDILPIVFDILDICVTDMAIITALSQIIGEEASISTTFVNVKCGRTMGTFPRLHPKSNLKYEKHAPFCRCKLKYKVEFSINGEHLSTLLCYDNRYGIIMYNHSLNEQMSLQVLPQSQFQTSC